jgi:hypothetical protein
VDPGATATPGLDADIDAGDGTGRRSGRSVTPLVAPVPFRNTQLGWGLMLMGGLIHRFDADTSIKPSTGMIGGFYTENGSWGVMAMENARLAGDRWRLRLMLGHPEIRYDYYGTGEAAGEAGRSVGIQQNINMAQAAALRRVGHGVYVGPTALYMGASIAVRDTTGLGLPPQAADTVNVQLFAPGLQGEIDTRDDDYWPVRGTLVRLKTWFFVNALGGDRSFQRYLLNWSWYAPVRGEQLVVATNVNGCGAGGSAPFWALCSIGAGRGGTARLYARPLPRHGHDDGAGGAPLPQCRSIRCDRLRGDGPDRPDVRRHLQRKGAPGRRSWRALPTHEELPDAHALRLLVGPRRRVILLRSR